MNSAGMQVSVIGGGIVGLAHAWSAAKRGHRVTVWERSAAAEGASVRNFGMYWPVGQPFGPLRDAALRSGACWRELAAQADVWLNLCGSIHLVHHDDEVRVIHEFLKSVESYDTGAAWLTPEEVLKRTPAANPEGLLGGMWSPTEGCVNPRQAIAQLAAYLAEKYQVQFAFRSTVVQVDSRSLRTAAGETHSHDLALICSGADFETLFPELLRNSGLRRCKLQMLATPPQPARFRQGPHLAGGLTLRHYRNFERCPSLSAVRDRIAREAPELDRYGIHVLVSQNNEGEVILGDSHEYDADITPFDLAEIDDLILRELRKLIRLPDWTIARRWHGIYAKHDSQPVFTAEPLPNVHVRTGTGGAGMTMSFGLAEEQWEAWSPA